MIFEPEDQNIDDLESEDLDTSLAMPEMPEEDEEEGLATGELDFDAAQKALDEEEKYDKDVEEGEWGSQDVLNIAAGAGSGVARAFTGTLSLAADMADLAAESAGFEGFEDKTLDSIHSTLDLSDNIADLFGADETAQSFKTSRAISEGITIGLQMMVGVGAVSAGAKASKAMLKVGGVKGAARLAKKGGQAVASGSKAATAVKTGAVIAGEEFLSQENANEGGFIVDALFRDAEKAGQQVDEIHDPVMGIISRKDPDFAIIADEFMSVNPKGEKDAYARLVNRLEGTLDGLVFGGAVGTVGKMLSAADLGKYFKAVKQTKVNANVAKDYKMDEAFVARKVGALTSKGEEATEEMIEGFRAEAKAARKEANKKTQEEVTQIYEKDIFGKKGVLEEVQKRVDETADFMEDPEIAELFTRASAGTVLDNTKNTFKNKAGEVITMESADIQAFRKLARGNDRLAKLTKKKKDFWIKASDRDVAAVLQDKRFLADVQKKFATDRLVISEQRAILSTKMGGIKKQIADFLEDTGEVPSSLLMSERALIAADTAMDLKGSAMNSLSGQFLRLAKDDKGSSVSAVNRFINTQRKRFDTDVEFARFEANMFSDLKFREKQMSVLKDPSKLMKNLDLAHDFYRQHLLTSIKGVVRNVGEGVVLSGIRMTRDIIADPRSRKAAKDAFSRDNTLIAFSRFKKAMQGQSDFDTATKLGASQIAEEALVSSGMKGKILALTQMGRRSVIGGDKLISTYNEAYFMNKKMYANYDSLIDQTENIESLAKKIGAKGSLSSAEVKQFNILQSMGVDPLNFSKSVESDGLEAAMSGALEMMQKNPDLIQQSKKYADKIAMNMEIEDMGALAKGMAPLATMISETPALRMFMPFPRPALSALDETIEWTPLLNIPRLAKRFSEGSTRDRREAVVQAGMSLTGGTAIWSLFSEGTLIGSGPKDQRANKAWKQFNTPNSIKIGDTSYSLQGTILGSIGTIIGEAHDIMETNDDGSLESKEKMGLIGAGIVSLLSEIPAGFWTDSLDPILRALKPQGERSVESTVATVVNNAIKSMPVIGLGVQAASQVASGVVEDRADTATRTGGEPMQRSWNEFKKTVGIQDIPKRVSFITGEELQTGATWKKPVLSMASFKGTEHKDVGDYITALLQDSGAKNSRSSRDYLRFTEPERTISSSAFTGIAGISYKLSADEYETVSRLTAQPTGFPPMVDTIREIMEEMPMEELVDQPQKFKDMAISLIKDTMTEYKSAAREEFMIESEDYQAWARETRVKEQDRSDEEASFNL